MHIGDTIRSLQKVYDIYVNGEGVSEYDEEYPLTYWALLGGGESQKVLYILLISVLNPFRLRARSNVT